MNDRIQLDIHQGIAHIILNRADKMNALDAAMFEAIKATGDELKQNKDVRAVVLSGNGRCFCAGLDLSNFANASDGSKSINSLTPRTRGISNEFQYPVWVWRELQVPVLAALHGATLGGGLQIALAADMRYASKDMTCSIMEIKWGLVPDMGGSQLLRGLVRDDIARELTYTGKIIDAKAAKDFGLLTDIVENPVEHALTVATEIASKNPDAIRANKRIYNDWRYQTAASGLLQESVEQDNIIWQPNQIEAVSASIENRPAKFETA